MASRSAIDFIIVQRFHEVHACMMLLITFSLSFLFCKMDRVEGITKSMFCFLTSSQHIPFHYSRHALHLGFNHYMTNKIIIRFVFQFFWQTDISLFISWEE